eukprot:1185116-Prorocentrum_minimum.AAC.2
MDTAEAKPLRKISRVLNEPNDNRGEYKATGFSSTCARYASGRVEQVDAQVPRQEMKKYPMLDDPDEDEKKNAFKVSAKKTRLRFRASGFGVCTSETAEPSHYHLRSPASGIFILHSANESYIQDSDPCNQPSRAVESCQEAAALLVSMDGSSEILPS